MPGRNSDSTYRFGFNGKENLDEIKGAGKIQDYGMRIFDPRLGRFLSLDPLARSFSWNSPFAFSENRVIDGIDLDGKEWSKVTTFDPVSGVFFVSVKLKVQVIDGTKCESSIHENNQTLMAAQAQFKKTFTQFDKEKNISYSAELEYEFVDADKVGREGSITLLLRETRSDINGSYVAGSTPDRPSGNSQTNVIRINTFVDGVRRPDNELARTIVHESGHAAGLLHPWDILSGSADQDAKQGVAPNYVIQHNIMNSGANVNAANRYYNNSGIDATQSTPGQLFKISETIDTDKAELK